jgi:hypothetical protein
LTYSVSLPDDLDGGKSADMRLRARAAGKTYRASMGRRNRAEVMMRECTRKRLPRDTNQYTKPAGRGRLRTMSASPTSARRASSR